MKIWYQHYLIQMYVVHLPWMYFSINTASIKQLCKHSEHSTIHLGYKNVMILNPWTAKTIVAFNLADFILSTKQQCHVYMWLLSSIAYRSWYSAVHYTKHNQLPNYQIHKYHKVTTLYHFLWPSFSGFSGFVGHDV